MDVRDKFQKVNYAGNLKKDLISGQLESCNFLNLMYELEIVDFKYDGQGYGFKNGDEIPNRYSFTMNLLGIHGPFETFSRVLGKPNCTIRDFEDSPRVWIVNYNNKFDFLVFVTKEYRGSSYEIIVKDNEIKEKIDPIDYIQWLKDLYFLIINKGRKTSQRISESDPFGEEWWDDENEKMITKFKKYIQL